MKIFNTAGNLIFEDKAKSFKKTLENAVKAEANLGRADLARADLTGANLTEANLTWANLTWANLTRANLTWADLGRANLAGADLDYASFSLSCKTKNIRVCTRLPFQLLAHICAMKSDDPEVIELQQLILPYAKKSHRARDLGLL